MLWLTQFVEKIQVITIKNFTTMTVTKYVITNNLSVLYNTREEAEAAFEAEVAKLETAFARGAFKRLYTVAPFIVK